LLILDLKTAIPECWRHLLDDELKTDWFCSLQAFLDDEWQNEQIFPPRELIFNALVSTPPDNVKVFLLGQDPYHDDGQAHGLCFSVPEGMKFPPSLRNIFKELEEDLSAKAPLSGCLQHWAEQGVLMLNTVLTVRAHQAASHQGKGWEQFTDAVIRIVNKKQEPVVFVLWGGHAQKKLSLIDQDRHIVVSSAHPSPLSAYRGFFGSRPFSKINSHLQDAGHEPIDWVAGVAQPELSLF
jgi:uracil-DNA glycosylase